MDGHDPALPRLQLYGYPLHAVLALAADDHLTVGAAAEPAVDRQQQPIAERIGRVERLGRELHSAQVMIFLGLFMGILVNMAVTVNMEVFQVIAVRGGGEQYRGSAQAAHGLGPGRCRFVVPLIHHHEPQPAARAR